MKISGQIKRQTKIRRSVVGYKYLLYVFVWGVTLIRADHIYANDILYQHKWNEFATQFESAHSYFGGIICLCVQKSFT